MIDEMASGSVFRHLSDLLGRRVALPGGRGRLTDLAASWSDRFPEIGHAVFSARGRRVVARMDEALCAALTEGSPASPVIVEESVLEGRLLLAQSLMDRQVVDVKGAKVVRVNDVHLLVHQGRMFLVHVDIGLTGLARRLGLGGVLGRLAALAGRTPREELVSWKFVQPLSFTGNAPVRLSLRQEELRRMHPGELADIIEELDPSERLALVRTFETEQVADVLEEAEETVQAAILRDLDTALAADILEEMEPAAAADLVDMLPEDDQQEIMAQMETEERLQLERLSLAEDDTAASLMTVDYLVCSASGTVAGALAVLREKASEVRFISYLYCTDDDGRLVGVVSLRKVLGAPEGALLAPLMNRRLMTLSPSEDLDGVAEMFMKYRLHALPVIDADGRMEGLIAFEHAFDELLPRFVRLAG